MMSRSVIDNKVNKGHVKCSDMYVKGCVFYYFPENTIISDETIVVILPVRYRFCLFLLLNNNGSNYKLLQTTFTIIDKLLDDFLSKLGDWASRRCQLNSGDKCVRKCVKTIFPVIEFEFSNKTT